MIEKINKNKKLQNLVIGGLVTIVCILASFVLWNLKLSENGTGALLHNNIYFGKMGIKQEELVQVENENDYSFNFVAYENLQDLSIYIKPNSAKGSMTVSLLTGDWLPLMSTSVNFADIDKNGFYTLFNDVELPNFDRQVLLLNISDVTYVDENRIELCSSSTGETALFATTDNPELLYIYLVCFIFQK